MVCGPRSNVGFNRLAVSAKRGCAVRRFHDFADAMRQVPRGFHATAEHALELARGDAFLRRAKQMDGLQPQPQRQVAILKNRALAHRKGRATACVAFAKANDIDARRMLFRGLGTHALKPADLLSRCPAIGTNRAVRPQMAFDVFEGGFFPEKSGIGKDGGRHGYLH
jgi:hypothetical protein